MKNSAWFLLGTDLYKMHNKVQSLNILWWYLIIYTYNIAKAQKCNSSMKHDVLPATQSSMICMFHLYIGLNMQSSYTTAPPLVYYYLYFSTLKVFRLFGWHFFFPLYLLAKLCFLYNYIHLLFVCLGIFQNIMFIYILF